MSLLIVQCHARNLPRPGGPARPSVRGRPGTDRRPRSTSPDHVCGASSSGPPDGTGDRRSPDCRRGGQHCGRGAVRAQDRSGARRGATPTAGKRQRGRGHGTTSAPHDDDLDADRSPDRCPDADVRSYAGRIERDPAARINLAKDHDGGDPVQEFVVARRSLYGLPAQFRDCFRGCGAVSGRLRHGQHVAVGARDGSGLQPAGCRRWSGPPDGGAVRGPRRGHPRRLGRAVRGEAAGLDGRERRGRALVLVLDDVRQVVPGSRRRMVRSDAVAPGELGPLGGRGFPCVEPAVRQRR